MPGKLFIKLPHFLRLPVVQLRPPDLSIFSCQITDRLCARMKVDPDIYCHRRLLLLTQIAFNRQSNNSRQEAPASYHQAVATGSTNCVDNREVPTGSTSVS